MDSSLFQVEREVRELQHISNHNVQPWTACAETVLFPGITIYDSIMIVPIPSFSVASQERYFTPSIMESTMFSQLLATTRANQKIDVPSLRHQNKGKQLLWLVAITSDNTMVTKVNQFLSDITSAWKCLANFRLIHSLEYKKILSSSKAFAPKDTTFEAGQFRNVQDRLLHKTQPFDQLKIS